MDSFQGTIKELENILIDNFLSYKSHTSFFLSHCHTDHMLGMDELFSNMTVDSKSYVYCSSISRIILLNKYGWAYKRVVKEVTGPQVITIPGNDIAPSYQVTVTPIPAGHCLGSIMFLFETVRSTILYTGDFRFLKNYITRFKPLCNKVKLIDALYVDVTFLSDSYWDFPSRLEVTATLLNCINGWICRSPNHNVLLVTSALYGYEFVFTELAKKLKCKVHVKDSLYHVLSNIPEVGCYITDQCRNTRIHASCIFEKKCLSPKDKDLMRVRLSAQWYKSSKGDPKQKIWKKVSTRDILFCYSTHCSCSELVDFLNYLQPKSVEPCTTAVGCTEEDTRAYIERLSLSWNTEEEDLDQQETMTADFRLERNYRFSLAFAQCVPNEFDDADLTS